MARSSSLDEDDPLTMAIAPPKDETPEQRAERERKEAEARRVSDEIDEQLRVERAALKKRKPPVKVLLLGQSESGASSAGLFTALLTTAVARVLTGKSTTLKSECRLCQLSLTLPYVGNMNVVTEDDHTRCH